MSWRTALYYRKVDKRTEFRSSVLFYYIILDIYYINSNLYNIILDTYYIFSETYDICWILIRNPL
jgi:hypothetical protein